MTRRLRGQAAIRYYLEEKSSGISSYSSANINPLVLDEVVKKVELILGSATETSAKASVVEFGSRGGALGSRICKQYRRLIYLGVEPFPPDDIFCFNTYQSTCEEFTANELGRDYISRSDIFIYADVLEHLVNPWEHLRHIYSLAKDGAVVVASIPNILHHSSLISLGQGRFDYEEWGVLDLTHLRFFTFKTMTEMFEIAGWNVDYPGIRSALDPEGATIIERFKFSGPFSQRLGNLSYEVKTIQDAWSIGAYQYIITATK